VRVLQALADTNSSQAQQYLREALTLAAPAGAVRTFVDLGAPLRALLSGLRPQLKPGESAFADVVLRAFNQPAAPAAPGAAQTEADRDGLVEPLTERELQVLRLLAEGLSNAEIAARLVLSTNTLKAHTQNIYAKMDVHSRVQMMNKARMLGLLKG
jgi:LuxR family maltose regulon positive regulatory protein